MTTNPINTLLFRTAQQSLCIIGLLLSHVARIPEDDSMRTLINKLQWAFFANKEFLYKLSARPKSSVSFECPHIQGMTEEGLYCTLMILSCIAKGDIFQFNQKCTCQLKYRSILIDNGWLQQWFYYMGQLDKCFFDTTDEWSKS